MSEIKHAFTAQKVEMTDGGVLWEVVTPEGERIGACSDEENAEKLEMALNMALTEWVDEVGSDATCEG